ncbi:MAG: NAD(P)-dependent oxidoreductase [Bacteroidales bacterium]|jgi:nucleoside-diphosphate-sugar epimerase|nr:NAD(P)-dependent oxidoreductase [Bacteroidales bacterium]
MDTIDFNQKKILVTGGKGFLGEKLCMILRKRNADVYCIDTKNCTQDNEYCVDITDRDLLSDCIQSIQPDIVFHLAALLHRGKGLDNFEQVHEVNYEGTVNLLIALKKYTNAHVIFTSTSEIYGSNTTPFTEDMVPDPISSYSISKTLAEECVKYFSVVNQNSFTVLRLFNFYGLGMPQNFFIPQMVQQLKKAQSFEMTHGEQARDFLHINDILQSLLLAASHPRALNETFNVCSGQAVTLRDLVIECKNACNSSCEIKFGAIPYRAHEIWNMVGDNSKISQMLGFKPQYDITDFLKELNP